MSLQDAKTALIIFAREPEDGKVKTRLSQELPLKEVTKLYKAFVKDVISVGIQVPCDQRFLYYAGALKPKAFIRQFQQQFILKRQAGGDLGRRIFNAFSRCSKEGFQRMVLIGTDCLSITVKDLSLAFEKLSHSDCVIGPSKDGGYYLIGLNRPLKGIFQSVDWSTPRVLTQTCAKIKKLKKKVYLLKELEDIDTSSNLKEFAKSIVKSPEDSYTKKILVQTLG